MKLYLERLAMKNIIKFVFVVIVVFALSDAIYAQDVEKRHVYISFGTVGQTTTTTLKNVCAPPSVPGPSGGYLPAEYGSSTTISTGTIDAELTSGTNSMGGPGGGTICYSITFTPSGTPGPIDGSYTIEYDGAGVNYYDVFVTISFTGTAQVD